LLQLFAVAASPSTIGRMSTNAVNKH
jgi:hypothetical protein